jgi:hypothetical protein
LTCAIETGWDLKLQLVDEKMEKSFFLPIACSKGVFRLIQEGNYKDFSEPVIITIMERFVDACLVMSPFIENHIRQVWL